MVNRLKPGTKIEAVAASMAGAKEDFVTIEMLVAMLDKIGFKGSSPGSTRTCIARDFKRREWARARHLNDNVHYYLVQQFFKDQEPNIARFIEMIPDSKEIIINRFSGFLNGKKPVFEETPPPHKKRVIIPEKGASSVKKGNSTFGGRQPPGLTINGCLCSYSTLMKAILCAQNEPFKKKVVEQYAHEIQIGLNQHSIGNGWYQVRKRKHVRECIDKPGFFEITNELLTENQRHFKDLYTILPNHVNLINENFKKAMNGELRPQVDPVIEEAPPEEIDTPEVLETQDAPETLETETPTEIIEETHVQANAVPQSDTQEIREMALALGLIDDTPKIDPKVFIGECIVSYLEATSNGNAFTAIPKVKPEVQPAQEKPIDKTEYVARLVELKGKMQTMNTAKEKAENLAKQLSSANHDLKQQKTKIESELNRLRFSKEKAAHLVPGESTTKVKLGSVARFR